MGWNLLVAPLSSLAILIHGEACPCSRALLRTRCDVQSHRRLTAELDGRDARLLDSISLSLCASLARSSASAMLKRSKACSTRSAKGSDTMRRVAISGGSHSAHGPGSVRPPTHQRVESTCAMVCRTASEQKVVRILTQRIEQAL